jgi:hypothetical protein
VNLFGELSSEIDLAILRQAIHAAHDVVEKFDELLTITRLKHRQDALVSALRRRAVRIKQLLTLRRQAHGIHPRIFLRATAGQEPLRHKATYDVCQRRTIDACRINKSRLADVFIGFDRQQHGELARREITAIGFIDEHHFGLLASAVEKVENRVLKLGVTHSGNPHDQAHRLEVPTNELGHVKAAQR